MRIQTRGLGWDERLIGFASSGPSRPLFHLRCPTSQLSWSRQTLQGSCAPLPSGRVQTASGSGLGFRRGQMGGRGGGGFARSPEPRDPAPNPGHQMAERALGSWGSAGPKSGSDGASRPAIRVFGAEALLLGLVRAAVFVTGNLPGPAPSAPPTARTSASSGSSGPSHPQAPWDHAVS